MPEYRVHPCRNRDEMNVEKCSREEAEFWAVYEVDGLGFEHWKEDFDTEEDAVHFMEML